MNIPEIIFSTGVYAAYLCVGVASAFLLVVLIHEWIRGELW